MFFTTEWQSFYTTHTHTRHYYFEGAGGGGDTLYIGKLTAKRTGEGTERRDEGTPSPEKFVEPKESRYVQ